MKSLVKYTVALIFTSLGLFFTPLVVQGYDPFAGVQGDVSKILNPQTADAELDAITAKHRRWTQVHQEEVTSQQMWNRANAAQMHQSGQKSAFQYQQNANFWDAMERAARDARNTGQQKLRVEMPKIIAKKRKNMVCVKMFFWGGS